MRCSMDWMQEPQVMPSTPTETEHRLGFCVMIVSPKRTQERQNVLPDIKYQELDYVKSSQEIGKVSK